MELLDIVDENGAPTGETVDRETAHAMGIRHRTSHVWLLRYRRGRPEVLLQKRSADKDSFPGCYDISSAGHIPAGDGFLPSALRELEEELGVKAEPSSLILCGQRSFSFRRVFHGKDFRDCQVSNVYVLFLDREEEEFTLQKSEVEAVEWFDLEECMRLVRENGIPHCIFPEELEMVAAAAPGAAGE